MECLKIMCKITICLNVVKLFPRLSLFPCGVGSATWKTISNCFALSFLTLENICLYIIINMLDLPHGCEWFLCPQTNLSNCLPCSVVAHITWQDAVKSSDVGEMARLCRSCPAFGDDTLELPGACKSLLTQVWHLWVIGEETNFKSYRSDVFVSGTLKKEFSQDTRVATAFHPTVLWSSTGHSAQLYMDLSYLFQEPALL